MKTYDNESAEVFLEQLDQWRFSNNGIEKKFQFKNFSQALGFLVQVGIQAEIANHHPELFNVYNKVTLRLTTHDAQGVTQKDFDLAQKIDDLY
ncbi:4a-hydroxytetrahydrobiopterin dehydratase [Flavobacterium restrictum]|uniref:Putative pterin-4-alpha-carbinolamine dehydratase n=1 Tax=Flavobacterium restrictum TaxID=2594428 RepID=A0A553E9P6_9FLAO|nr:4a-hydroxytetrahydrobiopterin dehydratase [Flavobacterium restrictum]TRX41543.1 4a-hydroxytetrahydrobiopterin dehydratase [Flavobacterium restrictum]